MKNNKLLSTYILILFIFLGCKDNKNINKKELYTLSYYKDITIINLYVIGNSDTLYIEKIKNDFHKREKIKLNSALINDFKQNIINNLKLKTLKTKRNYTNNENSLKLEISLKNKIIRANFYNLDDDFNLSDDFKNMTIELKESDKRIKAFFETR